MKVFHLLCFFILNLCFSLSLLAKNALLTDTPLQKAFLPLNLVAKSHLKDFSIPLEDQERETKKLCHKLRIQFKKYNWHEDPCGEVAWQAKWKTKNSNPLIYATFGSGPNTTLFLSGVHPDEITPIHLAFRFARYLQSPALKKIKKNFRIIIAPLINPEAFLGKSLLRTNGSVDLNRNFLTLDWYEKAHLRWKREKSSRKRYFPGHFPNSEIESIFQMALVDQYKPHKIFSVHAPLGFLDYDGPREIKPLARQEAGVKKRQFVMSVSKKTGNFRVVDYSFYPGSLGNYAGKERNIPTITLELQTIRPSKVHEYWQRFRPGFIQSFEYSFDTYPEAGISLAAPFGVFYTSKQHIF